ncbi:TlpA family protein disulfide reductase [Arsenicibacter rosenii]|uniref:Thioredoxin domain-containing protein n=1 Tax=Arsenicibacter rosenii TaxID=1750698 RepID=A0A1S2VP78_9BACT|nr:TlpA disulfide reductase family protein [Arsenicibacter rosenii]OIN60559.1 hypothetical protein BLX24_00060 [Arsenicibacter rosenii]
METSPKKPTTWLQYVLMAGVILILFFTDLGSSIRTGVQQLVLKTGVKNAPTTDAAPAETATDGYPALNLVDAGGNAISLSRFKGKVVFLNQWATWCPPCKAEMPAIERLYQSLDKNKVAFVMLSLDDEFATARDFAKTRQYTMPVFGLAGPMPQAFETSSIPTTIILKPDGQVAQRIEGMANYDTDEFRSYLTSLYK